MNRPKIAVFVLAFIIVFLASYRVYLLAELGELSVEYDALLKELADIQRDNGELYLQLLQETSITNIQKRAEELGLQEAPIIFQDEQ